MNGTSKQSIPDGTKVRVCAKSSWAHGEWGIITGFDGEDYHVAMYGGRETQLVFTRRELRIMETK